ncbi:unnamed protein product, partial [Oppiella nova]
MCRVSAPKKSRGDDLKRRAHNGIEKRRKDKINYWIYKLADVLPFKEAKRESKIRLLENVFQYVNQLKEKNESLVFGNINSINAIHVEEIRCLTKRCKELEEKNINYYQLLETAGIPATGLAQDIQFQRPTKYSKKITEQQLSEFLTVNKSVNKKLDQLNASNKRTNDFGDSVSQNSSKQMRSESKKRKDNKRGLEAKNYTPTPVLPNTLNPLNHSSVISGQTVSNSGPIVILNDQNLSTVSADDTPRLIVTNSSANDLNNALNAIQIRPQMGSQQLQIVSTGQGLDVIHGNTNLGAGLLSGLSGQILLNLNQLNQPPPPPQPQASAVLLSNGQLLPIITQPQVTQQPLIYQQPNQSYVLVPTNNQSTIFGGQAASIASNLNGLNGSSFKIIPISTQIPEIEIEDQKPKITPEKTVTKALTTTIETITISESTPTPQSHDSSDSPDIPTTISTATTTTTESIVTITSPKTPILTTDTNRNLNSNVNSNAVNPLTNSNTNSQINGNTTGAVTPNNITANNNSSNNNNNNNNSTNTNHDNNINNSISSNNNTGTDNNNLISHSAINIGINQPQQPP